MRWTRFQADGVVRLGYVEGDEVVQVEGIDPLPLLTGIDAVETGDRFRLDDVALMAPILPRRNVLCVGWNYLPHFEEGEVLHGKRELPDVPTFFTKATGAVIGPYDDVPVHADLTDRLDYEVELAVVIGERCVDVAEDEALDVIVGYMVAQDISARNLQKAHGNQWFKGKSLDGSCPIGPWVVSADEIDDPQDLDISCSIDGETRQASNTRHMIFPIARQIAELSAGFTLFPGDILLTGTPEGVGQSMDPPAFLAPGQVLESSVEGVGTIRNPIVA